MSWRQSTALEEKGKQISPTIFKRIQCVGSLGQGLALPKTHSDLGNADECATTMWEAEF
jgi:hypothetical protein